MILARSLVIPVLNSLRALLKKHTSGLPLSQMTPETHEIKLSFVGSMYIETVQDYTGHKNMVTLNVQHFLIQFRRYLVYFIDMLESGYQIGTEVNFLVRLVVWVIPSNSSKIKKTPEMNELESRASNSF